MKLFDRWKKVYNNLPTKYKIIGAILLFIIILVVVIIFGVVPILIRFNKEGMIYNFMMGRS